MSPHIPNPRRRIPGSLRPLTAVAAGAALLALTACSTSASGDDTVVLRVGELGAVPAAPALFEAAGLDQDLPYEIEWNQFVNAGPEYVEAAGAGAVDVGVTADTPLIFAEAAGAGLQAVAVIGTENPEEESNLAILVPEDSDIEEVADLAGATLSFQEGTITQYYAIKALEEAGLSLDDVTAVNLPVVDGNTALSGGDTDALVTLLTHRSQAEAEGARAISTGAGLIAGNSLISARTEAIEDPELGPAIEDLLDRYARAEQWKQDNPGEWAELYAGLSGLPVEVVEATESRTVTGVGPITAEVIAAQQDQSDTYFEVGVLQEQQEVSGQFDPRFNGVFDAPTDLEEILAQG